MDDHRVALIRDRVIKCVLCSASANTSPLDFHGDDDLQKR